LIEVTVESANQKITNLISTAFVPISGTLFDMNFLGNNSQTFTHKETRSFFLSKGNLDITFSFESRVFLPGDPIKIKMSFDNQTNKSLAKMTLNLIKKISLYASGSLEEEKSEILGSINVGSLNSGEQKYPANQFFYP